jgi:hypothetical protein
MARSKNSQSKHDAKVRQVARQFAGQGYKVDADVSGFPQPDTVRRFRPDVVAHKGRERKIVEVETRDSVDSARDQKQQRAFRQAAQQSKNTTFSRRVV